MRSSQESNLAVTPPSNFPSTERLAVVTVASQFRPNSPGPVPVLKLIGGWLDRAGFPAGTYAVLYASAGRIMIEAEGHLSDPGAAEYRASLRQRLARRSIALRRRPLASGEPPPESSTSPDPSSDSPVSDAVTGSDD